MIANALLPAIDLRGGAVVRLLHGDYSAETRYGDDPVAVAEPERLKRLLAESVEEFIALGRTENL